MDTQTLLYIVPAAGLIALAYAFLTTGWIGKQDAGNSTMKTIAGQIHKGAMAFLNAEYRVLAIFVAVVAGLLIFLNLDGGPDGRGSPLIGVAFIAGAAASGLAGFLGMRVATQANVRTAAAARKGLAPALQVAFRGGAVMGMSVVGLAMLGLGGLFLYFTSSFGAFDNVEGAAGGDALRRVTEVLAGFSMGASSIALFARVGGGIYTKAADVGADLVGKVEAGIPEDHPLNPATIADNVGDNVGDVAGMGADLFESYVASIVGAMILGALSSSGRLASLRWFSAAGHRGAGDHRLGDLHVLRAHQGGRQPAARARRRLVRRRVRDVDRLVLRHPVLHRQSRRRRTPDDGPRPRRPPFGTCSSRWRAGSWPARGSASSPATTARRTSPRSTASSSSRSRGRPPTSSPASGWASAPLRSRSLLSRARSSGRTTSPARTAWRWPPSACSRPPASSSRSTPTARSRTTRAASPRWPGCPAEVRKRTDNLDAVGNTTAAIGKGFAIGSAALAALVLFVAYQKTTGVEMLLTNAEVLVGVLLGAMLPFLFSAMAMKAVGDAAMDMIKEVRRQFREIPALRPALETVKAAEDEERDLTEDEESMVLAATKKTEVERCVAISTQASIKRMVAPGLLALSAPVLVGYWSTKGLGGLLAGTLASGVMLAIFMSNAGGAWDNAKKQVEEQKKDFDPKQNTGKGSERHKAAVIGDTVGDPFKDTAGPSLNILIKVMTIVAVVIAPFLGN